MTLDIGFLNNVVVLVLLVWPGLLSVQVYKLKLAGNPVDWSRVALQGFFYSVLNYIILSPLVIWLLEPDSRFAHPVLYWLCLVLTYLVFPAIWPLLWVRLLKWRWLLRHIQVPHATAWDYFFDKREEVFVLVKLKDGKRIGGLYRGDSFAASYPEHGDLYLSMVFTTDDKGMFGDPVPYTRGLLIRREEYAYMEIFAVPPQEEGTPNV